MPLENADELSDEPQDEENASSDTSDEEAPLDTNDEHDEIAGAEELSPTSEFAPISSDLAAGTYILQSALSDTLVVDVASGSEDNMADVLMGTSSMAASQRFSITYDEFGYATITNVKSNKVLLRSSTNVCQYLVTGSLWQKWRVITNQDGSYSFASAVDPSIVLDVTSSQSSPSTNLGVSLLTGGANQKFYAIDYSTSRLPWPLYLAQEAGLWVTLFPCRL